MPVMLCQRSRLWAVTVWHQRLLRALRFNLSLGRFSYQGEQVGAANQLVLVLGDRGIS